MLDCVVRLDRGVRVEAGGWIQARSSVEVAGFWLQDIARVVGSGLKLGRVEWRGTVFTRSVFSGSLGHCDFSDS